MSGRGKLLLTVILLTSCNGCQEGSHATGLRGETGIPTLEVTPKGVPLPVGDTLRFRVIVQGTSETLLGDVIWSASGGVIDQSGLFHAGDQAGTYEVRAFLETPDRHLTDVAAGSLLPQANADADSVTDGQSNVIPEGARIIFEDDFEDNHFGQWSGLAPASDPQWDGMGAGGAHIGDGYITDEQAHSGRLAWKALVDVTIDSHGKPNKSSLERWNGMEGVSEFYISAWYFIPTDYPAVASNIMQIKASTPSLKPVAIFLRRNRTLSVYNGILGKNVLTTRTTFPLGRWFNLTGRFVIADNGLVEVWIDDQKLGSVSTDTKDSTYAYPGVGNYVAEPDHPLTSHIYLDDVRVATPQSF